MFNPYLAAGQYVPDSFMQQEKKGALVHTHSCRMGNINKSNCFGSKNFVVQLLQLVVYHSAQHLVLQLDIEYAG